MIFEILKMDRVRRARSWQTLPEQVMILVCLFFKKKKKEKIYLCTSLNLFEFCKLLNLNVTHYLGKECDGADSKSISQRSTSDDSLQPHGNKTCVFSLDSFIIITFSLELLTGFCLFR